MVIANFIGLFFFLYLLWKNLKEDYQYEKIFNLGFVSIFGLLVGITASIVLKANYWFWLDLVSLMSGFAIGLIRSKMKFYESFDGLVVGSLSWVSLVYLANSISKSSLSDFILFWISAVCIALFFFFKSYYRTFNWYKSGRVGFAGLLTGAIYFLVRAISNNDPIISVPVAIALFLVLYKLSISKK